MRLAEKIATMARRGAPLPYLRRVAYLESHGTEWIDTGVLLTNSVDFELGIIQYTRNGYSTNFMGGDNFYVGSYWEGYVYLYVNGVQLTNWNDLFHDGVKESIIKKVGNTFSQHGAFDYKKLIEEDFSCLKSCCLFSKAEGAGRIKTRVTFFNIGDLRLIPVLDPSGRPAMHDEVSGQLFYNQGSGEFTWGELDASSALVSSRGGVLNA